jgi:LuxR family maltose regulon positive regulatory protein
MPKHADSQLRWSEQAQTYVLSSGNQESRQAFSSDWLEPIASFSFHCRSGMRYTVRKQRAQHGNSYWYAYRRLHGRIVKRYLGRTADLTLARLEEIAHLLESMSESRSTPPVSNAEDAGYPSPVGAVPLLFSKLCPPRLHASLLGDSG